MELRDLWTAPKKMHFSCPIDASNAVKAIVNEIKAKIATSSNAEVQDQGISAESTGVESLENNDFWSYHDRKRAQQLPKNSRNQTSVAPDIEISQYFRCPVSPTSVNPFEE